MSSDQPAHDDMLQQDDLERGQDGVAVKHLKHIQADQAQQHRHEGPT